MKKLRLNSQARKAFQGSSRGFTLIEVVIAMLLLGIIGVAVLSSLSYASVVLISVDRRATAESLARSQMEYVKNKDYSVVPWDYTVTSSQRSSINKPSWWYTSPPPLLSSDYNGYTVTVSAGLLHAIDDGIQQITVTITYYTVRGDNRMAEQKYTLVDYKRDPEA